MTLYYLIGKFSRHIAAEYYKLKSLSSKTQRTSPSKGFIYKAIFHEVIPTFAKVKGQFVNNKEKYTVRKSILQSKHNKT